MGDLTIRHRGRRRLYSLLLVLASTSMTLLGVEVAFRMLWTPHEAHLILDDQGRNLYVEDPVLGHRMRPDFTGINYSAEFKVSIDTNSSGYRGEEFGRKGGVARRIFAMGDSVVFGYGAEEQETIPSVLERELGKLTPRPVELFNFGCSGYGQGQAAKQLEIELPRQRPELVLVFFFLGNDPDDDLDFRLAEDPAAFPDLPPKPGWTLYKRLRHGIYGRSYLAQFIAIRSWGQLMRWGLVETAPEKEIAYMQSRDDPRVSAAWQAGSYYLSEIRDLCGRHGASLLVVALPSKSMVMDQVLQRGAEYFGIDPSSVDPTLPERRLLDICDREGIRALSLVTPIRQAVGRGEPVFFEVDPHPSPEGLAAISGLLVGPCLEMLNARDVRAQNNVEAAALRELVTDAADRLISVGLALRGGRR